MTPQEQLKQVSDAAFEALQQAKTTAEVDAIEVEYLGRKGRLTGLLRLTGTLTDAAQRAVFGIDANLR
ncbi:MAG: phenylalanine--tRNA ligase subunit alpha, partial [Armatimonadota bacterium]|nr:phenylalanine--tRNA ligase subunit alpha [Armatimonadota bacterium]